MCGYRYAGLEFGVWGVGCTDLVPVDQRALSTQWGDFPLYILQRAPSEEAGEAGVWGGAPPGAEVRGFIVQGS